MTPPRDNAADTAPRAAARPTPTVEGAGGFDGVVATAKAVADRLRAAVLRVLKEESYGVLELCRILDTPQPALSHHLKVLHRAGLLARRREGNSIFYRRAPAPDALHRALLAAIDEVELCPAQHERIEAVHRDRARRSREFFMQHAAEFHRNQARITEAAVYTASVLELVDRHRLGSGAALEIGPGEGELLCRLAERFERVVAIDSAPEMLARSAERVAGHSHVELLHCDVATLAAAPAGDTSSVDTPGVATPGVDTPGVDTPRRFQLVVAAMVVHHLASPPGFFRQARRLLEPGGVLVVAELCRHQHEWARSACGDQWLGFEPVELTEWAQNAGLLPGEAEFLAQKNGFQIQIHHYRNPDR